jgi:hypothetical protein
MSGHAKLESLLIGHHNFPAFASSQYPSVIDQFPSLRQSQRQRRKGLSILKEVFHAHQITVSDK